MTRTVTSFCRICSGNCGTLVEIGEEGPDRDVLLSVKGNRNNPLTGGYTCSKGLGAAKMHNRPDRIRHPLRREADGTFTPIPLEQALDEIAAALGRILAEHGPLALAAFFGTAGYHNAATSMIVPAWLRAFDSPNYFSSLTIDQSARVVTVGRLGTWHAGRHAWEAADVWMMFGTNPLVSVGGGSGFPVFNPAQGLKAAKARGLKLVVVDPRRTETAKFADLHLQIRPGEDTALICGLLRIILSEGREDTEFCASHVDGLDRLRALVEPFTPGYVHERAGIPPEQLHAAARLFADAERGCAGDATGLTMSPYSNLADHLMECLNVVCGRYLRAGDRIENVSPLHPRVPRHAEVIRPARWWQDGHQLRARSLGGLVTHHTVEYPTSALPDEILSTREDRIRSLFVFGGNPASAIPDQRKAVRALEALSLLVSVEPLMTATARLSHYVIPPKLIYERPDLQMWFGLDRRLPYPFAIATEALVAPPPGSDVTDDWYVCWSVAKRLGRAIDLAGVRLDMDEAPTTETLLRILTRDAQVPLETVLAYPDGHVFELPEQFVEPGRPGANARFDVAPGDVMAELEAYRAAVAAPGFTHLLTVRRMRHVMNSYREPPADSPRGTRPYNPAFLHPDDLAALGLAAGDPIELVSDYGRIRAPV
jgi:anaerobic selenocysteine-containing dehydrogenase